MHVMPQVAERPSMQMTIQNSPIAARMPVPWRSALCAQGSVRARRQLKRNM